MPERRGFRSMFGAERASNASSPRAPASGHSKRDDRCLQHHAGPHRAGSHPAIPSQSAASDSRLVRLHRAGDSSGEGEEGGQAQWLDDISEAVTALAPRPAVVPPAVK
jgi:hypothetical protein